MHRLVNNSHLGAVNLSGERELINRKSEGAKRQRSVRCNGFRIITGAHPHIQFSERPATYAAEAGRECCYDSIRIRKNARTQQHGVRLRAHNTPST